MAAAAPRSTEFEKFFDTMFWNMVDGIDDVPGLLSNGLPFSQASWDRKAAYLVWKSRPPMASIDPRKQIDLEEAITTAPAATTNDFDDMLG